MARREIPGRPGREETCVGSVPLPRPPQSRARRLGDGDSQAAHGTAEKLIGSTKERSRRSQSRLARLEWPAAAPHALLGAFSAGSSSDRLCMRHFFRARLARGDPLNNLAREFVGALGQRAHPTGRIGRRRCLFDRKGPLRPNAIAFESGSQAQYAAAAVGPIEHLLELEELCTQAVARWIACADLSLIHI